MAQSLPLQPGGRGSAVIMSSWGRVRLSSSPRALMSAAIARATSAVPSSLRSSTRITCNWLMFSWRRSDRRVLGNNSASLRAGMMAQTLGRVSKLGGTGDSWMCDRQNCPRKARRVIQMLRESRVRMSMGEGGGGGERGTTESQRTQRGRRRRIVGAKKNLPPTYVTIVGSAGNFLH